MAEEKDFWVPSDLALEILGFDKKMLEERISEEGIKKEIKNGIELVEISGEIDRLGLSEEITRKKLNGYLSKNQGESVGSVQLPDMPISHPKANASDHSLFLDQIAESLIDIKKTVSSLSESVGVQANALSKTSSNGKAVEELIPRVDALFQEVLQLVPTVEYRKEIDNLRARLEDSNNEIAKITATNNQMAGELERTQKNHQTEMSNLRNVIKTEISKLGNLKTKQGGGAWVSAFFSLLALLAVSFLIYEYFMPMSRVLKNQDEKINSMTTTNVEGSVQKELVIFEEKQKVSIDNIKDALINLNITFRSSFDQQKDLNNKLFNSMSGKQDELKEKIVADFLDKMKSIEKEIADLRDAVKSSSAVKSGIPRGFPSEINRMR